MKILFIMIYTLNAMRTISSNTSRFFELIDNSPESYLPKFVVIPNYQNPKEEIRLKYKFLNKIPTFINYSEWNLSIYVDQHYFNSNQIDDPIHIMCYLQYSIEKTINDVDRNATCKINLQVNNTTVTTNCTLKISRPPMVCSAMITMADLNFPDTSPTWGSVSAQLYFSPTEMATASINNAAIVFNSPKPVNWTIVQQDELFGKLAVGLPLMSVKSGSNFVVPISISGILELQSGRILIEFSRCLSINSIDASPKNRYNVLTDFENRENGVIRFQSRNQNRADESLTSSSVWPELAVANFTVTDKPDCWIRIGISKVKTFASQIRKYFSKTQFAEIQNPVPVATDHVNVVMIVFPQPRTTAIQLFSPGSLQQNSTRIHTYLLFKPEEHHLPQLIETSTCAYNTFSRGITENGCIPQLFSNRWVLPIQIKHWKSVVFNVFKYWEVESWKMHLSDSELSPIINWRVPRNGRCVVMYQSAVLKIGARLRSMNSIGMVTYLGSSLGNEKQWVDVSNEPSKFLITSIPSGVVIVSRNKAGTILVTSNATQMSRLRLSNENSEFLADENVSVLSSQWISISKFVGRCISDFDLHRSETHPNSEGEFINVELKVKKLRAGDMCYLFIGVVCNDGKTMMLENIPSDDYQLQVNGHAFQNGNLIKFQSEMNVILYESQTCEKARIIHKDRVDLSQDSLEERIHIRSSILDTSTPQDVPKSIQKTVTASEMNVDQKNSLLIAIYCVIGVVVMALLILILNCIIGFVVRRHSISNVQRRLSKSINCDGKPSRTADNAPSPLSTQDIYPPLLPPPGPIFSPNKQPTDWAVSSESGIGLERSSLGSQQDQAIPISTFRISLANESAHPSDSSSYIHQVLPFNDVMLETNSPYPSSEQSAQSYGTPSCLNRPYWSNIASNYPRVVEHGNPSDFRMIHNQMGSPEHRTNQDLV